MNPHKPIKVKNFQNEYYEKINLFTGRTKKIKMHCGNCEKIFSRRFKLSDFWNGYGAYPTAVCPNCNANNYIRVNLIWKERDCDFGND